MTYIYALIDPITSECRYIGKADNTRRRLLKHLAPAQLKHVTRKNTWISHLLQNNQTPEIIVLDHVPIREWPEHEKWWIQYMQYLGARLTNGTKGGDGGALLTPTPGRKGEDNPYYGKPRPDSVRKKIADSHIGVPKNFKPEVIAKFKALASQNTGAKNPFYGKTHSAETKAKWSSKRKGVDPLRNFTPEERAEKHKLAAASRKLTMEKKRLQDVVCELFKK